MLWARWLGWNVGFGMVLVGSALLARRLPSPGDVIVWVSLPVIAAFLIGVRFRSERWGWGPPVAVLTLGTVRIVWDLLGPQVPVQTAFGMLTPREQLTFPGPAFTVLIYGVAFVPVAALLAVPA